MLSPRRAVSRFTVRVAWPDQRGWAGDAGRPGMRHGGRRELRWVGGHTEAPDLSGSHNRQGAAAAAPDRRLFARPPLILHPSLSVAARRGSAVGNTCLAGVIEA